MKAYFFVAGLIFSGCAASREFHPVTTASLVPKLEQQIEFGFDSDHIDSDQVAFLDHEADLLQGHPGIKLILEGHTDSVGSDLYNIELGDRRARQVAVELVKRGTDPSQLIIVSEGERNPLTSNRTKEGRRQNRRVECVIRK